MESIRRSFAIGPNFFKKSSYFCILAASRSNSSRLVTCTIPTYYRGSCPHDTRCFDQFGFLDSGKTINQGTFFTDNLILEFLIGHVLRQIVQNDSLCHVNPLLINIFYFGRFLYDWSNFTGPCGGLHLIENLKALYTKTANSQLD